MTNKEFEILLKINEEQSSIIENRIKDNYKQSWRATFADGVSTGLYALGFGILITLFQNMIVLSNSGKRKYGWNWLISLSGFNIFFFLYIGEQSRYNKYFNKALNEVLLPSLWNEYKKGYDRVTKLTEHFIDEFRSNNLYTIDNFYNKKFESLGLVYGSSVRSKTAGTDLRAGIKSLKGGKMQMYTKLMDETRSNALDALIINSTRKYENFDAICNIRIATSDIASGASEVMVYGTVIKFK